MLLLLACQTPDSNSEVQKEQPLPYIYEEGTLPEPSLDSETVAAAVEAGLKRAQQLSAAPVFPAYQAAMRTADGGCPNYYDYNGSVYWYDNCSASGGGAFSGYSFYQRYENVSDGAGNVYNGESLSGVSRIETAWGHVFEAGGGAYYYRYDHTAQSEGDANYSYWISVVQGSFFYDGPEADGTWLQEKVAPDLSYSVGFVPSMEGKNATLDGSVGGLEGEISYLVFDNFMVWNDKISNCAQEPGGGFSVRGADGYWYDVRFDGATEWGQQVERDLCDGCGTLYLDGQNVGSVCVDASSLLSWEGSPW